MSEWEPNSRLARGLTFYLEQTGFFKIYFIFNIVIHPKMIFCNAILALMLAGVAFEVIDLDIL